MKKKAVLFAIPVALILLWMVFALVIGSGTKRGFQAAIDALNSNLGTASPGVEISESSYSRGLLSSEAITRISLSGESEPDTEETDIFLKLKAWHGPLMMTPEGVKFGIEYVQVTLDQEQLPEDIRKIVVEGFKGEEPVKLGFYTAFGGQVSANAEIAPFSSSDTGGVGRVDFKGFNGDLHTHIDNSFAKGSFKIGALMMEDNKSGAQLSMADSEGKMDYSNIVERVAGDGTAHLDFPEIKVTKDGESYAIKDMHFENVSQQKDSKLDMTSTMSIGGFKGPAKGQYADIISKLDGQLKIEFAAEGMDIEILQKMGEAQQQLQKAQSASGKDAPSQEQALYDYMVAVSSLLQPGFKMKNYIGFTNKNGKSELGIGFEYNGAKPLFELVTVRELVNSLEVAMNLQVVKDLIPADMVEKIQPAMAMGFLLEQDNVYKGDAILGGGELTVNGNATPVLKQMGPMLDMPIPWAQLGIEKNK